jgi:hypothetical protein
MNEIKHGANIPTEAERAKARTARLISNARRATVRSLIPTAVKAGIWWACMLLAGLFGWVVNWLILLISVGVAVWLAFWIGVHIEMLIRQESEIRCRK